MESLTNGKMRYILEFERNNRKSFMVEIRNNFLDLYFLGHTIEVRRKGKGYYLIASNEFSPRGSLTTTSSMVKAYGPRKWQISIDDINDSKCFNDIMVQVIAKIVAHKRGNISEGVSEINHFIDNRVIGKNGILVIDRQVVYPGKKDCRIDLLGLKRIKGNIFTFAVIELKNKNNKEIESVFSGQTKRYIDIVYDKYDDFMSTYKNVLEQKVKLGLLKTIDCKFARKEEISKKDIMGVVVLDNYNIRSDLKQDGLLGRAIDDWAKMSSEYTVRLFLKTNILDDTFFINRTEAGHLLSKFKKCNS
ncbi:MAG: hypothetical protein PHH20_00710 [Candidatus Omnitrophica bacterium]|nr:hypothetical protein [Candidatus Omnitrophota bacterium]